MKITQLDSFDELATQINSEPQKIEDCEITFCKNSQNICIIRIGASAYDFVFDGQRKLEALGRSDILDYERIDFQTDAERMLELIKRKNKEGFKTIIYSNNPVLVREFEPLDRIYIKAEDRGYIRVWYGSYPVGCAIDDILCGEFKVDMLGIEGKKKWERFSDLKTLIKEAKGQQRDQFVGEYLEIGNAYNFPKKNN